MDTIVRVFYIIVHFQVIFVYVIYIVLYDSIIVLMYLYLIKKYINTESVDLNADNSIQLNIHITARKL